jgi:hypothetical protein
MPRLRVPFEQCEGPIMNVEHHLVPFARIGAHEQHAAVTEPKLGVVTVTSPAG